MLKVLGCIAYEHDLQLVALSAAICALGCITTTTLLARADETRANLFNRWLGLSAAVFGCSVWSLHFVAMLAFVPADHVSYRLGPTAVSAVVVAAGTLAALLAWRAPAPRPVRVANGAVLLGLAISGMHYIGVAAMGGSAMVSFDMAVVAASVVVSIGFAAIALVRAADLRSVIRRFEVAFWLSLSICGLHFTGMTAITIVPVALEPAQHGVFGTSALAIAVGATSVAILIASLAASVIDQHMSQRALQDLGRMRLLGNLAQEVILVCQDGVVVEVNSAGERMFNMAADSIIGRSVTSLFTQTGIPALIHRGGPLPHERMSEEVEIQPIDGPRIPVELLAQPIDYIGKSATVVVLRDLTDRKRDEARIRHLARHDALTNLPNRHTLLERLDLALDAASRHDGALAVLYIDLDRFKPVNDFYGHAAGDALLIQASERLLAVIQPMDTLARIGGDEFVMILATDTRPDQVSAVATRVIDMLHAPFLIEGHRIEISASIGVALYPADGTDGDSLMRAADAAMYRAKDDGRGAFRFYEASMNALLYAQLQLEQELAGAIDRQELLLHYQPIVNGVSGQVETFEALIRWNHPQRGMRPPNAFIPLAEKTGLIDQIGHWVIGTACREAAAWEHPWRVSINVSPRQFHRSDVCDIIGAALQANRLAPDRVVVEVTEGVLIDDTAKAVATLNRLRAMGVRIALDDFGTGYSSLSYLQLFKFDKFKIDRSFVRQLGENDDALTITRTIVNLAHNLGLGVTAEGVETAAQLAIVREMGCDQIQGYLIAKPAAIEAFTHDDRLRTMALFLAGGPAAHHKPPPYLRLVQASG